MTDVVESVTRRAYRQDEQFYPLTIRQSRSDSVRRALAILDDLQRDAITSGIEDLSEKEFDALINDLAPAIQEVLFRAVYHQRLAIKEPELAR
uniref:Uncharacterized protein n=1 Tax=Candidatus Kentrum sp. LPFa TaxID=2126335 RepID=A0A450WI05_9GAMM|nr:MAG: hypothetical protein BECKLPF1236A_GA0070988_101523 [Candidatus Kentron sp. LPFa]